jgi:tetrahydromethanopterin S-methyltransferase subunit D
MAAPGVIFTNIPFYTAGGASGAMNTSSLNGSGTLTLVSGTTVYGNTTPAVSTIYFAMTYTAA